MTSANAAERLLASVDWSSLHALKGSGKGVQRALRELLASESEEAVERSYWGIENHAFAQGELFEVSEACASVLIASLVDAREKSVRVAVLDLMFQILSGHASASPGTPSDMGADLLQPRKPDRFRELGGEESIRIDRLRVACMT